MKPVEIGECIYCGDARTNLTREHILPKGLGGVQTLQKASCSRCQKITSKFELVVLRNMLGQARSRMGFPVKRKVETVRLKHANGTYTDVDAQRVPPMCPFPILPQPRLLQGLHDNREQDPKFEQWVFNGSDQMLNDLASEFGPFEIAVGAYDLKSVTKLVAKIALGFAVKQFGVNGVLRSLKKFIIEDDIGVNYLVGCEGHSGPFRRPNIMTNVQIAPVGRYWVAKVQLFARYGAPEYFVLVAPNQKLPSTVWRVTGHS